jgi:hypothetical protein
MLDTLEAHRVMNLRQINDQSVSQLNELRQHSGTSERFLSPLMDDQTQNRAAA